MSEKRKFGLLLVLLVVFVGINLGRGDKVPTPLPPVGNLSSASADSGSRLTIPDAALQVERLESPPRVRATDIRRNIFAYGVWRRPRLARAEQGTAPPVPAAAPPEPKSPVRFYGYAEGSRGGGRRVFLTDGDEIYVAAEGNIILRRYRLARVQNESVEIEDLKSGRRWVVPLEQP